MNKIIATLKLIFISLVFLIGLTYLTVEPPKKIVQKDIVLSDMPKTVELIGYETQKFSTKSIVKKGNLIFVGNHESIAIAPKLEKMLNLGKGRFVIVSNVSDAPWFIKRWQAHTKNEKLKGDKHLPWIYDRDGSMRHFLQVKVSDPLRYFIYKVEDSGVIKVVFTGKVKIGTLDGKVDKGEEEKHLKSVVNSLKKI
jgi:hypothetical protein